MFSFRLAFLLGVVFESVDRSLAVLVVVDARRSIVELLKTVFCNLLVASGFDFSIVEDVAGFFLDVGLVKPVAPLLSAILF